MSQNTMINPEVDNDEITIDLTELLMAIWRKLHLVILTGIVVALLAFIGTKLFITPMYTSVTKVYVLSKQEGNASLTYSDLQTGTSLTKDYMELVKSRPVLEQVIAILNLDMKAEELADTITVDTPTDTRILRISVENEDPKTAKEIADAIRESVSIQITEIMDADSVNTVEVGNLPTDPSSPSTMKNMLIGGILGVLLAIGIIVLIYILDDTVKTPEDVEYYLGLNVLTSIPIEEGVKKSKKVKGLSARQFNKKMKK
ncbi:MAG: Wzz/FepE/Etk N-terminal domain-containing protein [Faecalicatena sp.]|uniref:YveK family protein n=1 Tax=Faecalicatena sp. TaxID=2005360 RepID=UPI002588865B|nr:Wzz/FepE/Etk N-terminal domain-containing protein [Faecalicatena sp.]MCI6466410.1 Wzz/FepE/Etk N-terminal domain-containing protein [Faecalicatena sp.]MCI7180551.1 Wzz/FepE/Etk N-terminal domain-containing protein [Lachnospiraceae bacterium]MDY5619847.1 Wzz/FepE/Etk N-terminal domain-containing protein [Lachnospiraceae bacterium]